MGHVELLQALVGSDDATIPQVWAKRVEKTPHRTFLLWNGESTTYAEAWSHIRRFAGFLKFHGLDGKDQRVVTFMGNRPEVYWSWFGIQLTGGVYVALNRRHRGAILQDMLSRSRARLLVTEKSALPDLPDLTACGIEYLMVVDDEAPAADGRVTVLSLEQAMQAEPFEAKSSGRAPLQPTDPATVLYTSGTTGRSKAVKLPQNAFCRGAARFARAFGLSESDVFHTWFPLYHVGGQLHATMSMVVVGGTVALFPTFSASKFWEEVQQTGATVFAGLGGMVSILWKQPERPDDNKSSLRVGLCAPVPKGLHDKFELRFGVKLLDQFGMTEAEFITLPDNSPNISCGRPGPDYEVAIFDDQDQPLPVGEVGEIVCRPKAPGLMFLGYEGDEAATVQAWQNLWFHTGDLGYRDQDAYYYWVDRKSHAIRRRGENVSSWEVEQTLQTYPSVDQCAVLGVPSPLGEEDVKAVVVPVAGKTINPAALHAFCAGRMAHFMVPRYIEVRDALPYSHTQKVEKEKLRQNLDDVWDAEGSAGQKNRKSLSPAV